MNAEFQKFLHDHLAALEPLNRETNLAYWNASISGSKADSRKYAGLQLKIQNLYSDRSAFAAIERWKESGRIHDPLEKRQLEILHNEYLRNQIDPGLNRSIIELAASIENQYNVYRGTIDGARVTNNDIMRILKESDDPVLRRRAWETSKHAGAVVSQQLLKLVSFRNEAAGSIGFNSFYSMSLELNEQNEQELCGLFEELERMTAGPFRAAKEEIDAALAERFGVSETALEPWHYDDLFFQKVPGAVGIDLDAYFRRIDIVGAVRTFFARTGLDVEDILENSDLYEKPGKEQHAYCIDIDRNRDIRILANVRNDESWAGTMLHELGHALYDKHIDPQLPYLLRRAAHTFTTEAIAMLFGRFSKNAAWIQAATGISDAERDSIAQAVSKELRFSQLLFVRWCQVMFHFERELYSNPHADLNSVWWELVNTYQSINIPERRGAQDWASKIHIVSSPAYYHNYLLGELLASQLQNSIARRSVRLSGEYASGAGASGIGPCLTETVFKVGAAYRWDRMIERATGEHLSPSYFIDQFVS